MELMPARAFLYIEFRVSSSAWSPIVVEVPCASINPTSSGAISGLMFSKQRLMLRTWPAGFGAAIALPRPSELAPMEEIIPKILLLSFMASFILFSTNTTEPSPRIKPSALSSNGYEPFSDKVPIFANPIKDSGAR